MDTDKIRYLEALIAWRSSMANGRAKPDKFNNHPYVRESSEYVGRINQIDDILAKEFNIDLTFKTVRQDDREELFFKSIPAMDK